MECGSQLTGEGLQQLEAIGLSAEFYATWLIAVASLFAGICGVTAVLFIWRRSAERMALFSAIMLVALGATVTLDLQLFVQVYPEWRWLAGIVSFAGIASLFTFCFLFPDGQFVPRWTWVLAVLALAFAAAQSFWPGGVQALSFALDFGPWFLFLLAGLAAQIYRYRRVSVQPYRNQAKWVFFGVSLFILGFLGILMVFGIAFPELQRNALANLAAETTIYLLLLCIPLSLAAAILQYRLWDIDLVINRTLVYGVLTACVVGLYVLIVGSLGAVFNVRGNLAISLLATGVVAMLFQPLRERLQRAVNRLMYGERDEPYAVIARLGERLEGTLAPEAVLSAIVETVRASLKLPYAAVALEQGDKQQIAASAGEPTAETVRIPLVYQNERVGELLLGPRAGERAFSATDRRLLDDLARQAGVAVYAVRLTTDLQRLNVALQRSREQLVAMREEERRRIRRDLHDGVGPTLASLVQRLDAASTLVKEEPEAAIEMLTDLKGQVKQTIADIRQLVYALRPPVLDDFGLLSAIREHAVSYNHPDGLRVHLDAPESLPPLPAAVEVAAYRIVQEALTNVARHAEAQQCTIHLTLDDKTLTLEASDDGQGFSPRRRSGIGLSSMRERAEELGGTFEIESTPGRGTTVRACLPLPDEE
jgi:signal transduction histidine kinase